MARKSYKPQIEDALWAVVSKFPDARVSETIAALRHVADQMFELAPPSKKGRSYFTADGRRYKHDGTPLKD